MYWLFFPAFIAFGCGLSLFLFMVSVAWQQTAREGSLETTLTINTHNHEAERMKWKWGEAMNFQSLAPVTYSIQQGHMPPLQTAPNAWASGGHFFSFIQITAVIVSTMYCNTVRGCVDDNLNGVVYTHSYAGSSGWVTCVAPGFRVWA